MDVALSRRMAREVVELLAVLRAHSQGLLWFARLCPYEHDTDEAVAWERAWLEQATPAERRIAPYLATSSNSLLGSFATRPARNESPR